MEERNAKYW